MPLLMMAQNASGIFSFFQAIETVQAIVLIAGLIFLIAEIFMPGFGIVGGIGLALLILGIILTARTRAEAMVMFILLIIIVAIVLFIILRSAKKGMLSKKLILQSSARKEEGYQAADNRKDLIGREGMALTALRPAGLAEFDGEKLDVISEGAFIQPNTRVQIIEVEGRRIVVRPVNPETDS